MKAGNIVLFKFPQTDLEKGKLRPALVISKVPGKYKDWLICMISTQRHQLQKDFDIIISKKSPDFQSSGLKSESVIRISRLAVVNEDILVGSIGNISNTFLKEIRTKVANWILAE